jgi:hypothetical protein
MVCDRRVRKRTNNKYTIKKGLWQCSNLHFYIRTERAVESEL